MSNPDFSTTFSVSQSPKEVFDAINDVRGWWSAEIEGPTDQLNAEFNYHFQDVHSCQMKIVEMIPNQKVVWLVQKNYFKFTEDKTEWIGTQIIFDISGKGDATQLIFTHQGLIPDYECYEICYKAWTQYIQKSLYNLITTGEGQPNAAEQPQTDDERKLQG